jgi:hypothetical protein
MPHTRSPEHEINAAIQNILDLPIPERRSGAGFLRAGKAFSRAQGERIKHT